jgi:hypothetical protein
MARERTMEACAVASTLTKALNVFWFSPSCFLIKEIGGISSNVKCISIP